MNMRKNIAWISLLSIAVASASGCDSSSGGGSAADAKPALYCGTTPWKGDTKYSVETDVSGAKWAVFRLCDIPITSRAHELGGDGDGFNYNIFPLPYVGEISFKAKGIDRSYLIDDPSFHLLHFHFSSVKGSMDSAYQISGMLWENSGGYGGALLHVVDTVPARGGPICFNHPQTGHFMCEALYPYGPIAWDPNVTYHTTCDWDTNVKLHCVIKDDKGVVVFDQSAELNGGPIAEMSLFKIGNQAKDEERGGFMPSVKLTELEFKLKI